MKKIFISTVLLLIIFVFSFYWFAWQPSQIKHDCSWIKVTDLAVPAYSAMTEDELRAKGLLKDCTLPTPTQILPKSSNVTNLFDYLLPNLCEDNNKIIIQEYSKPHEEIPEKISWRKAEDEEYKFCLRDKGL